MNVEHLALLQTPCLLVFLLERRYPILDLSMIEANAQFISTNAKIQSEKTQAPYIS